MKEPEEKKDVMGVKPTLHGRIKARRKLSYKTQQDFVVAFATRYPDLSLKIGTYQKLETGHLHYVSDALLSAIADLLDIPYPELRQLRDSRKNPYFHDMQQYVGNYLRIAYSYTKKSHLGLNTLKIQLDSSSPLYRATMSFKDTKPYNYSYIGTAELARNILYIDMVEEHQPERLFFSMMAGAGTHADLLKGLCAGLTTEGTPFARRTMLLKITDDMMPIAAVREEVKKYIFSEEDFAGFLRKIHQDEENALITGRAVREFMKKPGSEDGGILLL